METSEIIKIVLATANEIRKTEEKPVNWEPRHSFRGSDWDIDKMNLQKSLVLITKRLDSLEVKINAVSKQEKSINLSKKRGPYKKKSNLVDEKDRKVTIVKGFDSKAFGVKTHNKINSKVKDALISNRFTPIQIISEVKKKHPTCSEFSGNELLRHIKLAKARLYSRIRDYNDVKPTNLGDVQPKLKTLKSLMNKGKDYKYKKNEQSRNSTK